MSTRIPCPPAGNVASATTPTVRPVASWSTARTGPGAESVNRTTVDVRNGLGEAVGGSSTTRSGTGPDTVAPTRRRRLKNSSQMTAENVSL